MSFSGIVNEAQAPKAGDAQRRNEVRTSVGERKQAQRKAESVASVQLRAPAPVPAPLRMKAPPPKDGEQRV